MSENHYTNIFNVTGDGNTVSFEQSIDSGSAEMLGMVLKFLLALLLSPIMIPFLLTANGIKLLQDGGDQDGDE